MHIFCPLASGSKGNSLFLGTKNTKILIDAGISAKNTSARLEQIGVHIEEIEAILVTHEHTDHILGLKILSNKWNIPIFANSETAKGIVHFFNDCPKFKIFSTGETFEFKDLEIHPFSIQHDTRDPVAFTICTGNTKLGICTDLGFVTHLVRHQLEGCHILYVEANHQPAMVHASSRPMIYKQRVLSRTGHLSNEECGKLLAHVAHPHLRQVYLAHLSSECNSPQTALNVVQQTLAQSDITLNLSIASQEQISPATPLYVEEEEKAYTHFY